MKTIVLVVRGASKSDERFEVEVDRVLVGSGAHCDIRLPLEAASWEHVVVTDEPQGVVARVVGADACARFDGRQAREHVLEPGTTISIGAVTIEVVSVGMGDEGGVRHRRTPMQLGAVVLLLLLVGTGMFVVRRLLAEPRMTAPEAPAPLGLPIRACPEPGAAEALGSRKLDLGRTKQQRYRFYARDGAAAVAAFETAAACFQTAKDADAARDAALEADAMRERIAEDYRGARVRLDRAIVRGDARTALAQVKLLREILHGNPRADAYVAWLALLESKLEAAASRAR